MSATTDGLRATNAGESHINIKCASLIGHSIECFDFHIYATATVLVLPRPLDDRVGRVPFLASRTEADELLDICLAVHSLLEPPDR